MSYRIVYGKDKGRFRQLLKRRKMLIFVASCVALVVAGLLFIDRTASSAALENMVEAVRSGETLSDAVVAFCQEIIENAQLPQ